MHILICFCGLYVAHDEKRCTEDEVAAVGNTAEGSIGAEQTAERLVVDVIT